MQKTHWDYLILTASNDSQARAYEAQLSIRRQLGLLRGVRQAIVVPDPGGRRVGSGGSTLFCLLEILNRQIASIEHQAPDWIGGSIEGVFNNLRILIIHAGGDSQRLPVYGPCGKIFIPVPGENDQALPLTLFDRQLPTYLALPPPRKTQKSAGQIVITSGDVLLQFDPAKVRFAENGVTGLGSFASPDQAKNHGVFCRSESDTVRLFLQKPSLSEQESAGAIDPYGRTILDIGVMNLAVDAAVALLKIFGVLEPHVKREPRVKHGANYLAPSSTGGLFPAGGFKLTGEMGEAVCKYGLDFYREICCGLGTESTAKLYLRSVQNSGSRWDKLLLGRLFESLSAIPFHVSVLPECDFLHFGTSQEIINSGNFLNSKLKTQNLKLNECLSINNEISSQGQLVGENAWIEGCKIGSPLTLGGENVVVGIDVDEDLSLPVQMCLDVIPGQDRSGKNVWFVRCYGVRDSFNDPIECGASFCGAAVADWLKTVGAEHEDVWDEAIPPKQRSLFNARLFPAFKQHSQYRNWLWMFDPAKAEPGQLRAWRLADRYSPAEIATLANLEAFARRRYLIRGREIQNSLRKIFSQGSEFSSAELAFVLRDMVDESERSTFVSQLLDEARWRYAGDNGRGIDSLIFPRIIHTLGSALSELGGDDNVFIEDVLPGLTKKLSAATRKWLDSLGLALDSTVRLGQWSQRACGLAFEFLSQVIITSGGDKSSLPRSTLRSDEIVWGRAPARLDTGGGWTDTPPYCLQYGGCVVNSAVNLNGQPPIQVYARVIDEPVIRVASIDLGTKIEITSLDELLDYRQPGRAYALVKAALALSGFSPQIPPTGSGATEKNGGASPSLRQMLDAFGGGIELTTLAAIPKGSGLGTSSIMGAVILAVIKRIMGRTLTQRELFHAVLRLEQLLTTGGGWQDQIGGVLGGAKMVTTEPGLVPDPRVNYLPADVLDPAQNEGQTLLYYTGITRLAKNILEQVVGRYLNRDRDTMSTLRQIHALSPEVAEALSQKDIEGFGQMVDTAWQLNKQLDPNSTNDEVQALLTRVKPYIFGAKLLGAGGGGFLLMVCKSPKDAKKIRKMLQAQPANERARFFDFNINPEGLVVTVC